MLRLLLSTLLLFTLSVARPALAQSRPSLLPYSGENPYMHRARGKSRQATGIALMVLGSMNLAVTLGVGLGLGIPCSRPGTECGLASVALVSTTATSGVIGTSLLAAGIPLYLQGRDWERDGNQLLAETPEPQPWVEPAELRRDWRRDRALGIRLLTAGGISVGVGLAGTTAQFVCLYSRLPCNAAALVSTLTLIGVGGGTGLTLLSVGASYFSRAQRSTGLASLRLSLGPTIALGGEF